MIDPVDADLNRHLRQLDEDEAHAEALEERIAALTAPGAEYDPFEASNLSEALSELSDEDYAKLGDNLESSERAITCQQIILVHTIKYWSKMAEKEAGEQFQHDVRQNQEDRASDRAFYRSMED